MVLNQSQHLSKPLFYSVTAGLVSRDHIQYAPYDVSLNVRRTRRQLHSKPKYKSSEWETVSVTNNSQNLISFLVCSGFFSVFSDGK